jgi:hypothetical protein
MLLDQLWDEYINAYPVRCRVSCCLMSRWPPLRSHLPIDVHAPTPKHAHRWSNSLRSVIAVSVAQALSIKGIVGVGVGVLAYFYRGMRGYNKSSGRSLITQGLVPSATPFNRPIQWGQWPQRCAALEIIFHVYNREPQPASVSV